MSASYQEKGGEVSHNVEMVENPMSSAQAGGTRKQSILQAAIDTVQHQDLAITEEEKKKVLRKIDWHIIPLAAWACGLQFVDKSALGAAATYGLRTDLGLVGQEYSWCVSIFYFGYLAGSFVSGRGLQYFHAGKFIGASFFCWGITLLGCMGAQNYATLMALRMLLGVFESSLVPGLLLITTMWYTQREQPFRFGLWTICNGVMPVPFLVIYYGMGHVTTGPIQSWRLIFLLVGVLSVLTGVLLFFFMPDAPTTVKWLNEREKAIALKRVADDQLGAKDTTFKWAQVREAATDYRAWMMVLQMFFSQAAGNVTTNFLGIIISGFGYTALKAQLYTAPNFAVQAVSQMIVSAPPTFIPRFKGMKQPLAALFSIIALIGIVMLVVTPAEPQYQNRRLGSVIIISCSGVNYTVVMSVIGSNVAGFTKRQVTTSAAFFCYCLVNIITPQTFIGAESPRYPTGMAFVLSFLSIYICLSLGTWLDMRLENNRRERLKLSSAAYATGSDNDDELSGLKDLTDRENKHFRYAG